MVNTVVCALGNKMPKRTVVCTITPVDASGIRECIVFVVDVDRSSFTLSTKFEQLV